MTESGKDYGVKVVRAYDFYRVGEVIYPPGLLRSHLVAMGYVECLGAPAPKPARKQAVIIK